MVQDLTTWKENKSELLDIYESELGKAAGFYQKLPKNKEEINIEDIEEVSTQSINEETGLFLYHDYLTELITYHTYDLEVKVIKAIQDIKNMPEYQSNKLEDSEIQRLQDLESILASDEIKKIRERAGIAEEYEPVEEESEGFVVDKEKLLDYLSELQGFENKYEESGLELPANYKTIISGLNARIKMAKLEEEIKQLYTEALNYGNTLIEDYEEKFDKEATKTLPKQSKPIYKKPTNYPRPPPPPPSSLKPPAPVLTEEEFNELERKLKKLDINLKSYKQGIDSKKADAEEKITEYETEKKRIEYKIKNAKVVKKETPKIQKDIRASLVSELKKEIAKQKKIKAEKGEEISEDENLGRLILEKVPEDEKKKKEPIILPKLKEPELTYEEKTKLGKELLDLKLKDNKNPEERIRMVQIKNKLGLTQNSKELGQEFRKVTTQAPKHEEEDSPVIAKMLKPISEEEKKEYETKKQKRLKELLLPVLQKEEPETEIPEEFKEAVEEKKKLENQLNKHMMMEKQVFEEEVETLLEGKTILFSKYDKILNNIKKMKLTKPTPEMNKTINQLTAEADVLSQNLRNWGYTDEALEVEKKFSLLNPSEWDPW